MTEQDDWKQRYLTEAQAWESSDDLLRRVVGRLAIAAEGDSADLDAVLARMQRHARGREDRALEADLKDLTTQIKRMGTAATAAPAEVPLASPASGVERDVAGGSDVREVLVTLVEEIAVAQPGAGGLETLRETLQREPVGDWHRSLDRVIGEIRSLIQRISSDKQALAQLVKEVSEELGDISHVLIDDQKDMATGREESTALQQIMDSGVRRIQKHIDSESDIEKLKLGVNQSLDGIRAGIADFMDRDGKRVAVAEARNEALRERIGRMEKETRALQVSLQRNQERVMRDPLTGVRSRVAYDETLAQEMSRYRRYGEAFCLAVLDIDFFKKVNDTFGHSAGDKALKLVAGLVEERIRETDFLFRVGGEEFVLLLPRTALASATPLVESVRQAVGAGGFHYEGQPVSVTLSAGVTEVHNDDTALTLFDRADDAMYRAKKAGRDRLVTLG